MRIKGMLLGAALAVAGAPLAADGFKVDLQGGAGDLSGFRGKIHYVSGPWKASYGGTYDDYGDAFNPFADPNADGMHILHEFSIGYNWWEYGFGLSVGYFDTELEFDNSLGTEDDGVTARVNFFDKFEGGGGWRVSVGLGWYEGNLVSGGNPVDDRDGETLLLDAGLKFPLGDSGFSAFGKYRHGWMGDDFIGGPPNTYLDIVPQRYLFGVDFKGGENWSVYGGWMHVNFDMGSTWNSQDRGTDSWVIGTRIRFN